MSTLPRRHVLSAGLGLGLLPLRVSAARAAGTAPGGSDAAQPEHTGRAGGSPARHAGGVSVRFSDPATVLRDARPESVGLASQPIAAATKAVRAGEQRPATGWALFPGASALMGYHGKVVGTDASGFSYLWQDASTMAPPAQRIRTGRGTVYDLASCSKLFTSITVVQLIEAGLVELEAPVARYLPEFAANGKEAVTVRQCLTHTSGFVAWLPLWSAYDTVAERIQAVMDQPLDNPPGTVYLYSDLNLITLGVLVQRMTGKPLDQVVRERITRPLGMSSTGYNPVENGWATRTQIAATEYQTAPPRGMVWGSVHDENAWSLDGVAGHAGVFSTVDDLSVLCQALLNGGTYRGRRILSQESVRLMVTDFNQAFPGDAHGLGFELDQRWYMQGMSSPVTAGHTGYTGTSVVVDFDAQGFAILLTNRVHPVRTGPSTNPARRAWAQGLALAQPVQPVAGRTAWFTGVTDATTSTLTATLTRPAPAGARLSFDTWLDMEETDPLTLETTSDGTTWTALPFTLRDRGTVTQTDGTVALSGVRAWEQARADLPAGATAVRWRMVTDALYLGRGVYVDSVRAVGGGVLLDGEEDASAFVADGWVAAAR
ncbi:serine hydrolase [Lapillicoccus jejuensis]|uniref:CubicO group peptidase (Beta-lactamase class C family) n=1 Tax=Lapillicoccus jejuensis TaxID=402171 RepID=A0A542E5G2_9MICO|nr:serine hydrolase [Lapillicoccus jejuensis]TQJ10524.1 CubicO group peptidase (beta-lactamase class C family) [Lapillicoccus jejuensis]